MDFRIKKEDIIELKNKKFTKYKCDKFLFTNSVTQIVGLFIDDKVYALTNIQEPLQIGDNMEDVSIYKFKQCNIDDIKSAFIDVDQINNYINDFIDSIVMVNDKMILYQNDKVIFEVEMTRAIIFKFSQGNELCFIKDAVFFSEEIIIYKGYNLIDKVKDNVEFINDWNSDGYRPVCHRELIEL